VELVAVVVCGWKAAIPSGLFAGGTGCPNTPKLVVAVDESEVDGLPVKNPPWEKNEVGAGVGAASALDGAVDSEPVLVLVLPAVAVVVDPEAAPTG